MSTFQPALTPEELGLDLEEDSPDLTAAEVEAAIDTESHEDFAEKVLSWAMSLGTKTPIVNQFRRRGGVLYSVHFADGVKVLFKVEWLRKHG